jgi:TonB family protein
MTCFLVAGIVVSGTNIRSLAQSGANNDGPKDEVRLAKLSETIYPPLARQTHISGDVELALEIRADGSIQSATVVSGHPLLTPAALDSARRSQFECRDCGQVAHTYRLSYSFQLGPTEYCNLGSDSSKAAQQEEPYPRVTQSQNHVTVVDRTVATCDPAGTVVRKKVRSAKCLYLWRCGLVPLANY